MSAIPRHSEKFSALFFSAWRSSKDKALSPVAFELFPPPRFPLPPPGSPGMLGILVGTPGIEDPGMPAFEPFPPPGSPGMLGILVGNPFPPPGIAGIFVGIAGATDPGMIPIGFVTAVRFGVGTARGTLFSVV